MDSQPPKAVTAYELRLHDEYKRCFATHPHGCDCRYCLWSQRLAGIAQCRRCNTRKRIIDAIIRECIDDPREDPDN